MNITINADPLLKALNMIQSISGLNSQETVERFRQLRSLINNKYRENATRREILGDSIIIRSLYYFPSMTNIGVDFLSAAALVRKHFEDWKKLTLCPKSIPPSLQAISEDEFILYHLIVLEAFEIISFDPNLPFLNERSDRNTHKTCKAAPQSLLEDLISKWHILGRPYDEIHFSDAYEMYFNPIPKPKITRWSYTTLNSAIKLFFEEMIPSPITRIIDYGDFGMFTEMVIKNLVFNDFDFDMLESVRQLFPEKADLVPNIIKQYRYMTIHYSENEELLLFESSNNVHHNSLGKAFWPTPGLSRESSLHHRCALKQIQAHPELFRIWEGDAEMDYLYRKLVLPALEAKHGSRVAWKL